MAKKAIIFPGQGSQKEGMGKVLFDKYEIVRDLYDEVSEAAGFDVADASFGNTTGLLGMTGAAQPAIFAHSMACFLVYKAMGGHADATAGFSLGECTAVCASGALGIGDSARMIAARARTMQKEAEASSGSMYAILGADENEISDALLSAHGYCEMVNFNCPGQIVIAGEEEACKKASGILAGRGFKASRLSVNAAFHSKLMKPAARHFACELADMKWSAPQIELFSNITGTRMDFSKSPEEYFPLQMLSPVRWHELVERMIKSGYDEFIELGPSRTLSGMVRRISREVAISNAETPEQIEGLV